MLTARRMRERMAAEAAGLPPPEPPRPESIPTHEHDRLVTELERKHFAAMQELRAENARLTAELASRKPAAEPKTEQKAAAAPEAPPAKSAEPQEPRPRRRQ